MENNTITTVLTKVLTKGAIIWSAIQIHTVVLLSLAFLMILTFLGSRRKRDAGKFTRAIIWISYRLSGSVTILALGKLTPINDSISLSNLAKLYNSFKSGQGKNPIVNNAIRGLWAPLLMIHFGGPDTITAYAFEDTKSGRSLYLTLALKIGAVAVVLYKTWTNGVSFMSLPLFLVGIIKNLERIFALEVASGKETHINRLIDKEMQKQAPKETKSYHWFLQKLPGLCLLVKAYQRFECLKPYLEKWSGHPLTHIHLPSLNLIEFHDPEDVFRVAGFELGFMYDMLYTKASISFTRLGISFRFISFFCLVFAFSGFTILCKNQDMHLPNFLNLRTLKYDTKVDIFITYILLLGAIVIEIYAFWVFLRSDWAIIHMIQHNWSRFMTKFFEKVLPKNIRDSQRWSHSMKQLNLIQYCLTPELSGFEKLVNKILIALPIQGLAYKEASKSRQVPKGLKELIVQEVKGVNNLMNLQYVSTPGRRTLARYKCLEKLKWSIQPPFCFKAEANRENNFARLIIMWHIATDICFYSNACCYTEKDITSIKVLSDYMMYLLATHPTMLSVSAGNQIFEVVCDEVKAVKRYIDKKENVKPRAKKDTTVEEAKLRRDLYKYRMPKEIWDPAGKGNHVMNMIVARWKVVPRAQKLAHELMLKEHGPWRILGGVWAEILCYAARNCPWNLHAKQLRRGGDLIIVVWLLLNREIDKPSVNDIV